MKRIQIIIIFLLGMSLNTLGLAAPTNATPSQAIANKSAMHNPSLIPPAPTLNAKAYVLMDANSGKIIAQKNMDVQRQPASLTKLMTLYLAFRAIKNHTISLDDKVLISKKAWQTGGSKMFIKVGDHVPVKELIQGVIVDSGNDASIALAEYIGGNEKSFVDMMNQQAKALGMNDSHFIDSTGLPHPKHLSTAHDLAILSKNIITQFPDLYKTFFSQKWFKYNNIRQPNRNRLLWRFPGADGLKTGHTNEAGFCLIASAVQNNERLISVVLGAPSDEGRTKDSIALLRYGFHYFGSKQLYESNKPIAHPRVWYGKNKTIDVGVKQNVYVTLPKSQLKKVTTKIYPTPQLKAPIKKDQQVGTIQINLNDKILQTVPLVALSANPKGGIWRRSYDSIMHHFGGAKAAKKDSGK